MLVFAAMRRIDKLLIAAIVPPFLVTLTVLTFILFSDKLGRFSELLITRNASLTTVLLIAGTLAPSILIFSLPLSFLVGTLIGFGGLSGENQITALRACGVPLRRLLQPVLGLAAIVGVLTGMISVIILPRTNDVLESIKNYINLRQATAQILPRVFNEDFTNIVFYLEDLSIDRQRWERVFLADNSDPNAPRIVMAREGTWVSDASGSRLQLHLEQGTIYEVNPQDPAKDNISLFGSTDIPVDFSRGSAAGGGAAGGRRKPSELGTFELWLGSEPSDPTQRREEWIEFHKRWALPFSVIGFAFIGLALGICSRRGGRTSSSVLGLVLVILFYVLFMNGLRLASAGQIPPWLGAWSANIILSAIGLGLVIGAEQNSWLTQCMMSWHWKTRLETFVARFHLSRVRDAVRKLDDIAISSTRSIVRLRYPRVLDTYISRGFVGYLMWATIVCFTLFIILTLFDLLDDIIRNRIPVSLIISYFVFLTPHILLLVVPMSVLLATLIQFGILEKSSEVTAMKAGGWSLYRIAFAVLLLSGFLSGIMFFMQDYILPYANIRQDAIRNQIKGNPPQTFTLPRKWIFGKSDRIYNYDLFDSGKDVFVGLNVYEVDLKQLTIKRRVYARQAVVKGPGKWELEGGWVRDFGSARGGFLPFKKQMFTFPEEASYFEKDIFEPGEASKLTYVELNKYIMYLMQSGYNATELQVSLNKKISFPLSCFVMAILGIPFSFSMGKRGAFYGITAAVAIAISYWGLSSVFEVMGTYGLLSPLLAAWAPNLLFSSAGLALLLTVRT